MKRIFSTMAVVAASVSVVACGSNEPKEIDSLAYAVGMDYGLSLKFGMEDFDVDHKLVIENLEDFYKNGDIESEEFAQMGQRMMEFQYTRLMPYAQAKYMRDRIVTDCPDTLPALPELYDENFSREDFSAMLGKDMGARIQSLKDEIDFYWVMEAINDGLAVDAPENIDSLMRMTQEQRGQVLMAYSQRQQEKAIAERERQQEKAIAERERLMTENAEKSAEWLAEIEKNEGVQKTESGILYRIDREGTGAQPAEDTDVVLVNYEGKNREGKVFDSSYERGEPISFALNRVIKGWTEGMKLVKEGGQITLWIPSELAYGAQGTGADIGPNEALEFKVELLKVNPEE